MDVEIDINITGRNKHVSAIKQAIHTIKEQLRAIANQLPFNSLPHRLIVEMVYDVVFWLNAFPHADGVHDIMETHIHTTLEEGQYEEPTAEDEHVVEEMNMTNMQREHEENDVTENTEPEHEENDEAENADESQSAVEVENGYEEAEEDDTENDRGYTPTHGYNLRPRPTKHHPRLNLMQLGQNQHTWLVQNHIYMS